LFRGFGYSTGKAGFAIINETCDVAFKFDPEITGCTKTHASVIVDFDDDGDDDFDVIVKKTAAYNELVGSLAGSGTQDWGLQLLTPSTVTDYTKGEMTGTITLTATLS